MFRNLQLIRLPNGIHTPPEALAEQLGKWAFKPCGATDRFTHGWVEPKADSGLVFAVGNHRLLCLAREEKILPAAYVRRVAGIKADELEEQQGFRPGRKQMSDIREQVELELLPRAFTKLSRTHVWIDNDNGWMVIDGNATRCDEVIEHLKLCLDKLPQMALPSTLTAPCTAMTQWLANGEAPGDLTIDRDCELTSHVEERPVVKYTRHNLDNDEIRHHIASGKAVTRIALTWNERVSFVLTEDLAIKRIALLDLIKEEAVRQTQEADDWFAATFLIHASELAKVIAAVIDACGGMKDAIETMENSQDKMAQLNDRLINLAPDEAYSAAKQVVKENGRASISLVQRHLRIGYNAAARLIERMEKEGIVSPADRDGKRSVTA